MRTPSHKLLIIIMCFTFVSACQGTKKQNDGKSDQKEAAMEVFKIKSSAFADGDTIPVKYTCDGDDISPALEWSGAPAGIKSFALICDDPDAPMGTWVHWVLFNLAPVVKSLPENFTPDKGRSSPDKYPGLVDGINDFRRLGYGGPCPPKGPAHRYLFKLYALDITLTLKTGASKADVEKSITGHVIAQAELIGKYKR
jgi:Raf kinase inhibitor-like YbhB/YbcL family protein